MRSPKTSTLIRRAGSHIPLRLLPADRAFLRDLARLQILSAELADRHHYAHLKGGCRRSLGRLEAAGLITRRNLGVAGASPATLYQFASDSVARAEGPRGSMYVEFQSRRGQSDGNAVRCRWPQPLLCSRRAIDSLRILGVASPSDEERSRTGSGQKP